ncbi:MAG: hypothetical protein WCI12_03170 [Actinomycetes bacterium]
MTSIVSLRAPDGSARSLRRVTTMLWVVATLLYVLTASGWIQTIDVVQSIAVATQFVDHGGRLWVDGLHSVGVHQTWVGPGGGIQPGVNHHFYVAHAFGEALVMVPGAVLRHLGVISDIKMQFVDSLVNPIAAGTLVTVAFRIMHRLSGRLRSSLVGALLIGFASMVWPYAHFSFDATPTALFLMLALLGILGLAEEPTRRRSFAVGAALAAALAFRVDSALMVTVDVAWLLWTLRSLPMADRIKNAACAAVPLALIVVVTALYNVTRFGGIFDDGHRLDTSVQHTFPLLRGVADLLISPGRGILLFSPLLVVAAIGVPWLFRKAPGLVVSQGLGILAVVLFVATLTNFSGFAAWGPRFLVPVLPIALLPIIGVLVRWRDLHLAIRTISVVCIVASAVIQIVAVCLPVVYFDYFTEFLEKPMSIEAWHGGGQLWRALHQAGENLTSLNHLLTLKYIGVFTIPDFWWASTQSTMAAHRGGDLLVAGVLAVVLAVVARKLWLAVALEKGTSEPATLPDAAVPHWPRSSSH